MKVFCFAIVLAFVCCAKGTGQLQDMDSNSVELKPIIEFSETMLNRAVNSLFVHKVGNVLKAQKQIVSGVKYYLTFEFKETTCLKNGPNDTPCVPTRTEICSVQVWSRPWVTESKMQMTTFSCKPQ